MPIDSVGGVNAAMMQFFAMAVSKGMEEELRDQFLALSSSPIVAEASSQFCELAYARRDELDQEQKDIVAEVCQFATDHMFYELHLEQRGNKMRKVFEGKAVASPPEPLSKFVKPPEPEEGEEMLPEIPPA